MLTEMQVTSDILSVKPEEEEVQHIIDEALAAFDTNTPGPLTFLDIYNDYLYILSGEAAEALSRFFKIEPFPYLKVGYVSFTASGISDLWIGNSLRIQYFMVLWYFNFYNVFLLLNLGVMKCFTKWCLEPTPLLLELVQRLALRCIRVRFGWLELSLHPFIFTL